MVLCVRDSLANHKLRHTGYGTYPCVGHARIEAHVPGNVYAYLASRSRPCQVPTAHDALQHPGSRHCTLSLPWYSIPHDGVQDARLSVTAVGGQDQHTKLPCNT